MGCICSKGVSGSKKYGSFDATISINRGRNSLTKVAPDVEVCDIINNDILLQTLSQYNSNNADHGMRNVNVEKDGGTGLGIVDVPNGLSGEHVNAGWPSWLALVAAEAVSGWLPRRADSFEKIDKIGQGTYSTVYRALDLHTGKTVALKKVRFLNMDPDSVRFMAREINILRGLDHPNVIKLEGIITSKTSCNLYLVFEYMEHDLAGLVSAPGIKFTEPQVKCFMQQLLSGLDHCHKNGILHRDIKGSNLLVDKSGVLRIGDFGLATKFGPNKKEALTSRVVTLWYRPPELLLGATEYGAAVDLWSAGCILAELLAGKPIMPGRTEVEQLHKIFKLCGSPGEDYWKKSRISKSTIFKPQQQYPCRVNETFNDFPSSALNLLNILLAIESEGRETAASALQNEFFTTKPLACDPSSFPKYPPSKEYDIRLQNEEVRRQRGAAKSKGIEKSSSKIPTMFSQNNTEIQENRPGGICNRDKYNELGSSEPRFPIKNGRQDSSSTVHAGAYGDMRGRNNEKCDNHPLLAHSATTLERSHGLRLKSQRSYVPQHMDIGDFSGFLGRNNATASTSEMQNVLNRPASNHKPDEDDTDSTMRYEDDTRRIHYSGPLLRSGGNVDDLLKEHERQIQVAVRKARLEKVKTKKNLVNEIW